jgi:hypothetical protein
MRVMQRRRNKAWMNEHDQKTTRDLQDILTRLERLETRITAIETQSPAR